MTDKPNGNGGVHWTNGSVAAGAARTEEEASGTGSRPAAGFDAGADDPLVGVDASRAAMDKLLDLAGRASAWGEPVKHGTTLLLPTSEVVTVAGFGSGGGSGAQPGGRRGGGGGGGGGGKVLARPVAVVEAGPDGVRVRPVVDVTKIALAALTAFGFVAAGWLGLKRPLRSLCKLRGG